MLGVFVHLFVFMVTLIAAMGEPVIPVVVLIAKLCVYESTAFTGARPDTIIPAVGAWDGAGLMI